MKFPKGYSNMISQIADLAAKEIGVHKKFEILWFAQNEMIRMNLLMGLMDGVSGRLLGLNFFFATGDRVIGLDPLYCTETTLENVIRLIAHEVCHFKIQGHGNDFKALEKKALKPFKFYLKKK